MDPSTPPEAQAAAITDALKPILQQVADLHKQIEERSLEATLLKQQLDEGDTQSTDAQQPAPVADMRATPATKPPLDFDADETTPASSEIETDAGSSDMPVAELSGLQKLVAKLGDALDYAMIVRECYSQQLSGLELQVGLLRSRLEHVGNSSGAALQQVPIAPMGSTPAPETPPEDVETEARSDQPDAQITTTATEEVGEVSKTAESSAKASPTTAPDRPASKNTNAADSDATSTTTSSAKSSTETSPSPASTSELEAIVKQLQERMKAVEDKTDQLEAVNRAKDQFARQDGFISLSDSPPPGGKRAHSDSSASNEPPPQRPRLQEPTASEPTASEPTASEPTASEPTARLPPKAKLTCTECWEKDRKSCTGEKKCAKCSTTGARCVYAHCKHQAICWTRGCAYMHPGQWDETDPEWNVDYIPLGGNPNKPR